MTAPSTLADAERKLKKIIGQSLSIGNYDPTGDTVFEALDMVRKSQGMPE